MYKFCENRGELKNVEEMGGYAICIIGLGDGRLRTSSIHSFKNSYSAPLGRGVESQGGPGVADSNVGPRQTILHFSEKIYNFRPFSENIGI